MSVPRRNIVRPQTPAVPSARLSALRRRLSQDQDLFVKWMRRLRRAFHAMEKHQRRIARLESQIAKLENNP